MTATIKGLGTTMALLLSRIESQNVPVVGRGRSQLPPDIQYQRLALAKAKRERKAQKRLREGT